MCGGLLFVYVFVCLFVCFVFCSESCMIEFFLLGRFFLKKYERGCNCI